LITSLNHLWRATTDGDAISEEVNEKTEERTVEEGIYSK